MSRRMLSCAEVRAFYDRVGRWQDTQAFYEAPVLDLVVRDGAFEEAQTVFEIGCGTGRLAERLLRDGCRSDAQYEGVDLSATMVESARDRLGALGDRATVRQTDGELRFDRPDGAYDRVVATYVLDLLAPEDAREGLHEAHRLLAADGRLCVAGLTWGPTVVSGAVSRGWDLLHALRPQWVGGCRPVEVRSLLRASQWRIEEHRVVIAWGVPSEVLVAVPR